MPEDIVADREKHVVRYTIPLLRDDVARCTTSELVRGIAEAAAVEVIRHRILYDYVSSDLYEKMASDLEFLCSQAKRYKAELDLRFPAPSGE